MKKYFTFCLQISGKIIILHPNIDKNEHATERNI